MPKVSVIMNCYNGERFVKEAIDSVYAQTFLDWEIVFWDNASTDRTSEIARSYDSRLRYFRGERNVPLGPARNLAFDRATGEWIALVDHDDVSFPTRLERQMAAVANGSYVLCSAGIRDVDENGNMIRDILPRCRSGRVLAAQLRNFDLPTQTTMINREALRKYGMRINEECFTSDDYNLFMRLAAKGDVCIVPEILSTCRIVPGSLTNLTLERHAIERFLTLEQLKAENPGIEMQNIKAFQEAAARGHYYQAKYLMTIGSTRAAQHELRRVVRISPVYLILFVISFSPRLWRLVHDRKLKSRLTRLLLAWRR